MPIRTQPPRRPPTPAVTNIDSLSEKTDFGFEQVSPEEKTRRVKGVFESVATKYDLMNDLMSGGLHRAWKRFAVEASGIRRGARVLDVAGCPVRNVRSSKSKVSYAMRHPSSRCSLS